jgi:hypothetical protein
MSTAAFARSLPFEVKRLDNKIGAAAFKTRTISIPMLITIRHYLPERSHRFVFKRRCNHHNHDTLLQVTPPHPDFTLRDFSLRLKKLRLKR